MMLTRFAESPRWLCLALGLNQFYERVGTLPRHLWVQADNTSREGKNQYLWCWAAILCQLKVFKSICLAFLTKGENI